MEAEAKEKEATKEAKKNKIDPIEPIRALLERPTIPETVKNSIKNVDIQREFDTAKVAKIVMKALDPILANEIEQYSKVGDAFDKLVSNEEETEQSNEQLEFCLDALKIFANELPDLSELMVLKFKNTLIRCVLCNNVPDNLRNEASIICERIMEKTKYVEDDTDIVVGEKWLSVYFWVLKRSLSDSGSRNDVKRIWAMHRLLNRYVVTDSTAAVNTLKAVVVSPNYLLYKEGRQNIAYLLSFNKTLIVPFYTKIKASLPIVAEKSKGLACSYGEIFNMAWTRAAQEVREVLEDEIFQRFMEIYLKLDRPSNLHPGTMGKIIFRILSHLHNSRRLLQLSSAITRLYEPILWRAMKSHHPLERCNAAELFLDVFPLERPEATIVENSNFLKKQFNQIMALLKDESHFTRIVTIRGVILVFQRRIECLSNNHCREILSWLANELANDGSSYLVRVAVWEFFASLAASSNPPEFLRSLLPQLTNHFHDTSESVRKSFTLMLVRVGENDKLGISVTDIAPKEHLIARLALEGESVGKLLSKLLMKSVYSDGMKISDFISRLKRLIIQCPLAAENLFRWSANVITVQNANFIIMAVLVYLRQFTKDRLQNRPGGSGKPTCTHEQPEQSDDRLESTPENDDDEEAPEVDIQDIENTPLVANQPPIVSASPSASPVKKKRRKNRNSVAQQNSEEGKNDEEEIIDIDGPTAEIHAHMIGCVHTVWVVFSKQFDSHPTIVSELNQVLTVCLQNYLRCYTGTPAWYATISMASLVPLTKLSENTTASSSCLAELRRTDLDTPLAHTEAIIYTLTAWNRGYEIIELAIDYIDPAFKLFQLNSSSYPTVREGHGGQRSRVVRFVKDGGKEMIGLRLLSLLFKDYHNETRLMIKHYDRIFELYTYLEGIKTIIEVRYSEGLSRESGSVITDAFIRECFDIMIDLIPVLNKEQSEEESDCQEFNSMQQMINIIEWALRVLLPHVKEIEMSEEPSENDGEVEEDVVNSSEDEEPGEEVEDPKKKRKNKTKKKTKKNKPKKVDEIKEDLYVSILKSVIKQCNFMIKTKVTDTDHIVVSSNFALSLIKSEGKYWFTEDCIDLIEAISEHTRAWCPKDEDQFLSVICPSVYSHLLLSLTSNAHLTLTHLKRHGCDLGYIKRKLLVFPGLLFNMYGATSEKFLKVFHSIIGSCVAAIQAEAIKVETIETEDKVEDLPLGVSMVTQSILSRIKLVPLILPSILNFAVTNREDGVLVVCTLSYLYTLLESNTKKFERLDMVDTVQSLYKLVQALSSQPKTSSKHSSPKKDDDDDNDKSDSEDSFFLEPLSKLDVKKIGTDILRKIADSISCQLVQPLTSIPPRKSTITDTIDQFIVPSISGLKV